MYKRQPLAALQAATLEPARFLKAEKQQGTIAPGFRADLAVSYTHLRAHETVLDLVCRLLLEKKTPYLSFI